MRIMIFSAEIGKRINSCGTFGFPKEVEWGRQTERLGKIDQTGWGIEKTCLWRAKEE